MLSAEDTRERGFRDAGPADSDTVIAMMAEFYAGDGMPFDADRARAALAPLLRPNELGHVWLIEEGGAPAGYLVMTLGYSLEFGGRDAFVDELYIRPDFRRRGLGRRAVEVVAKYCLDTSVRALHLEVGRENEAAQALYRQAGFEDRKHWLMTRRLDIK